MNCRWLWLVVLGCVFTFHAPFSQTVMAGNKRVFGVLSVDSIPDSAGVVVQTVQGKTVYRTQTPFSIKITPGRYIVRIEKDGYEPLAYRADISRDKTLFISKEKAVMQRAGNKGQTLTNSLGMAFVYISPGPFMMGQTRMEKEKLVREVGDKDYNKFYSDELRHRVELTKGYYMQATEVTVGQYMAFLNDTGNDKGVDLLDGDCPIRKVDNDYVLSGNIFGEREELPMTNVSWFGARAFSEWLSKKENAVYRLPTEAEWEYAGRAGTTTPYSTGECLSTDQANFLGNHPLNNCGQGVFRQKPLAVASFNPNAWGLYDMQGNVWEWCGDWYGNYSWGSMSDPQGSTTGTFRVLRGGSWNSNAGGCRLANRSKLGPKLSYNSFGFRLVMTER